MAFLAAKEAPVITRQKLQEAADPTAEESAALVVLITDAVNAAIKRHHQSRQILQRIGPPRLAMDSEVLKMEEE